MPIPPLTFRSITARSAVLKLKRPVIARIATITEWPLILIDLATDEGVVGRAYLEPYIAKSMRYLVPALHDFGIALKGRRVAPFELFDAARKSLHFVGYQGLSMIAVSGLDMAAWDALAVARGLPLVELLGGSRRPIPAYDSHSMDGVELGLQRAERAMSQGFRALKTKIGYATLAEDLRVVRALRQAIGDDTQLLVDYNQGLTVPEGVRRICALEGEGISWVEEPTLQEDYAGHARIREQVRLPIQMGENWCGPDEMAKALEAGACDLAMPDAMKIGGVTGWLRAAAIAQAHGLPMSSHIFQEVSVHLLAVTPTCHLLERMDLAGPVLGRPLAFENGAATAPALPGTGIAWNEDAVRRFEVRAC